MVPLGVRLAVEWYIRAIVDEIPVAEKRLPAAALGSYRTGLKAGWSALLDPT